MNCPSLPVTLCDLSVLMLLAVAGADMSLLNKSMPVGPVAGGIMGCFLLLALGVYCYRCYSHRHSRHCNGALPGEGRLRDSNLDFEDFDDANNGTVSCRLCRRRHCHLIVFCLISLLHCVSINSDWGLRQLSKTRF